MNQDLSQILNKWNWEKEKNNKKLWDTYYKNRENFFIKKDKIQNTKCN